MGARENLLESVIEAVRSIRALRFGLPAGSLGSGSITEKSLLSLAVLLRPQILKFARMHETVVMEYYALSPMVGAN